MKYVLIIVTLCLCACAEKSTTPVVVKSEQATVTAHKKRLPLRIKETITPAPADGQWHVALSIVSTKALRQVTITLLEQDDVSFVTGDGIIEIDTLVAQAEQDYALTIAAAADVRYVRWSTSYTVDGKTMSKKFTAKLPRVAESTEPTEPSAEKEKPKVRPLKLTPATPKQK